MFAVAYVTTQVGRALFVLWAMRREAPQLARTFQRIAVWMTLSGVFWIVGAFAEPDVRLAWWALALGIETFGPWALYWGPACYLLGAAWFKWLTNDRRTPPLSHVVGLALIALLAWPAFTHAITPLVCGIATTLVFAVVACWETVALSTIRTHAQPDRP